VPRLHDLGKSLSDTSRRKGTKGPIAKAISFARPPREIFTTPQAAYRLVTLKWESRLKHVYSPQILSDICPFRPAEINIVQPIHEQETWKATVCISEPAPPYFRPEKLWVCFLLNYECSYSSNYSPQGDKQGINQQCF